jgi:site-specific recombinase XerD
VVNFSGSVHISPNHNLLAREGMRDLYNRKALQKYWITRAESLAEPDKTDVLKLVQHMQDTEKSALWIVRCITALIIMRKQLCRPFREATREDIRALLKWMEDHGYSASSHEKFRQVLKLFYKIVYANGEYYPEQVKWFSVKLGKEKRGKDPSMEMSEYLEEAEVRKMVDAAPTLQKKAFLACLYESGARPEEFLRLTSSDLRIDAKGALLMLRGKTGERMVRIIAYAKLLQQWLSVHPLQSMPEYPIWISEATNYKNQPLGIRGAEKIIEAALPKAGLANKHTRLYLLRHSRATHLAKHLTEAQMCVFFGWVQGTQVVRRYIHLSGKDVDNVLLAINNGGPVQAEEYKLKTITCIRCAEGISPGMNFCPRCSLAIDLQEQYTKEIKIEQKLEQREHELQDIKDKLQGMEKLLLTIQPLLKNVKPEALADIPLTR